MMGNSEDGRVESSTEKRELFFFDFAKRISSTAQMPLMVTGGVTKRATAETALNEAGVDMVGIGRAFAYNQSARLSRGYGHDKAAALPPRRRPSNQTQTNAYSGADRPADKGI